MISGVPKPVVSRGILLPCRVKGGKISTVRFRSKGGEREGKGRIKVVGKFRRLSHPIDEEKLRKREGKRRKK